MADDVQEEDQGERGLLGRVVDGTAAREGISVGSTERRWSLRREWSRAFTIMLVMLVLTGLGTVVGVRYLVDQFSSTVHVLDERTSIVVSLNSLLDSHEQTVHAALEGKPFNKAAFVNEQNKLSRTFDQASRLFGAGGGGGTAITIGRQDWRSASIGVGLWGDQVATFASPTKTTQEVRVQNTTALGYQNARDSLLLLHGPTVNALHASLDADQTIEEIGALSLALLFGLALAVTIYFRRRMSRDLLRPVATLHRGVLDLQAGQYEHPIDVARRDELGELAEAFNGMARALLDSHLALTLRATHDSLTGLPNRASLAERLAQAFAPDSDRRARSESVLFIDIDDFKDVNDSLGHEGGDDLLIQMAGRLNDCVRPGDLVARLGGDEFAIVVIEEGDGSMASEVAERILDAVRAPFVVNGDSLIVAVSIGVAHKRPETTDAAELLRQADFAMYMAKGGGKNRYQLFDAQMHADMVGRSALKTDLGVAVAAGQLRLDYQPVADLRTGEVVGVEALVRWQHPTLGLLAPVEFISVAEETGDIDDIGCWVLETATRQVAGWRHTMDHCADLWVSVNLSAFQLPNEHSRAAIERILADPAVEADKVVLEITESALTAEGDKGSLPLEALKSYGVRVAIDDFGTGFSSLSTLATLPVDIIKIDNSFVSGAASDSAGASILEGIVELASKLSLGVIAEGIEEIEQLERLRTLGCPLGQGFLLARPVAAETLGDLLAAGGLVEVIRQPGLFDSRNR